MANFVKPPSHFREKLQKKGGGWLHVKPESTHVRVFPAVPGCMPIPAECRGKRCQAGRARQAGQAGQAGQVRQAGKVGKARQAGSSAKRDRREFREGLSPQKACLSLPFRQNRWSRIALPDLEVGNLFEPRIRCHRCLDVDADLTEIFSVLLKLDIDY